MWVPSPSRTCDYQPKLTARSKRGLCLFNIVQSIVALNKVIGFPWASSQRYISAAKYTYLDWKSEQTVSCLDQTRKVNDRSIKK